MNIGIIGLGLIGGSLGRAISSRTSHKVYGLALHEETMQKAELCKAIHHRLTKDNAKDLDMLIITLYPREIEKAIDEWAPFLKKGCIVLDCGGTKRSIMERMRDARHLYEGIYFVDDLLAGYYYYFIYPGYEPSYDFHWEGYIQVSGTSVSLVQCGDWYFYEDGDDISSGTYNATTGVLQWICYGSVLTTLTPITLD